MATLTFKSAVLVCGMAFGASSAFAQVTYSLPTNTTARSAAPVDMSQITPMERLIDFSAARPAVQAETTAMPVGEPRIIPGSTGRPVRMTMREDFSGYETSGGDEGGISAQNFGINSENTIFHYNDYLAEATWTYPQRTVGRLVFTFDGVNYSWCTASLINVSILVTAGHCVHQGGNGAAGFIQQATFYPGYDDRRPLDNQLAGRCDISDVTVTQQWFDQGDILAGYDVALAVCRRLYDSAWANYRGSVPGFRLGTLGFCYENCARPFNMLTQIGYPQNYYGGGRMTISQHLSTTVVPTPDNAPTVDYVAGSGMRGGSSGGPHISNIGEISDTSLSFGQMTDRNVVFAVTSWGYNSHSPKIQGASPLSGASNANNFPEMFNHICRRARRIHGSWVCSPIVTD